MHNEQATAHTKGPWRVSENRRMTVVSDQMMICQLWNGRGETEANAALIAAAPDLYELAKIIAKLDANYGLSPAALFHVKERAEAAIAKATSL